MPKALSSNPSAEKKKEKPQLFATYRKHTFLTKKNTGLK
jgi:hypothetical protein